MARRLRVAFPGAIYHVTNRGNRQADIFRDDADRLHFLETLGEACAKTGGRVHAFCLLPNHFHLVLETPQPNLTDAMKWLLGTYTARFNRRHRQTGHLFGGRYQSVVIAGEGGFLRTACDHVHLNPARARLLPEEAPLRSYRWSSLPALLAPPRERPAWLHAGRLFGECGLAPDSPADQRKFEQRMEELRMRGANADFEALRHAWCFGGEQFRREVLTLLSRQAGPRLGRGQARELAEANAERIVEAEFARLAWRPDDLASLRKGDPRKLPIVRRLRVETTVTLDWIAQRLRFGTRGHLVHLLYWEGRPKPTRLPASKPSFVKHVPRPEERVFITDLTAPLNPAFD